LNSLPKDMIEHALMDGAYGINLIRYIEIPLCGRALSNIFRIIWSVGWSAIIAAEMLGVQSGMGYRLLDFRYLLRYREMFIYIGIIGLIGIVTDYLLLAMLQNRKSFT
ncbi:MAG: ABC transporter permease subunit, partial [Candidatus Cloacimonetes bacterium]|nr:ABC transporter permease subunit [Candidatus Cloacimonadota bacterium]